MNSPPRGFAATRRVVGAYNRSYGNKPFVPLHRETIEEYECIRVEPTDPSFFYRMDERKPFWFDNEKADAVFGSARNTYFGLRPSDIMEAYKTHTNLYVVKPNTPIVLIDMGILENVERIVASAPPEFAHSISTAFPIKDGVVTRHSEPANSYIDKIDHDRRALEYLCTLPGIDGYYVDVEGLHPEIGLCAGSLEKLTVVDMFRIRGEHDQPRREKRIFTARNNSNSNNNFPKINRRTHGRFSLQNSSSKSSGNGGIFGALSFEGGKRKRRTHRKRQTNRKQTHRK
jgi:hypothetical protein